MTDIDFARLEREYRHLARELTPADRQRLSIPPTVWPNIESMTRRFDDHKDQTVVSRHLRQPRHLRREAFALAAALLVIVFGAAALVNLGRQDATVLAAASLDNEGLPVGFAGRAEVEFRSTASTNELEIVVASLPPESDGSFYELWMIDPALEGMVSLGPISVSAGDGGQQALVVTVPEGVDFERFPVVDLSIEPTDGDPTHSGQSILRGTLEPVEGT